MPRSATSTAPGVTVSDLVDAALGILDGFGLADLSMRRVAAALHVQPSALYWHVKDKQTLLALVTDHLLDRVQPPPRSADWVGDLRTRALALHEALLSVRDAAELTSSTVALGLGGHRLRSLLAEPLQDSGLDPGEATVLVDAACSLLLGSAVMAQQRRQAEELGVELGAGPPRVADFAAMLEILLRRA